MAARKKKEPEGKRAFTSGIKITPVAFDTPRFITLTEPVSYDCGLQGAFVRVRAAEGIDGEEIRQSAVLAGARAVRIIPAPKAQVVPEAAHGALAPRETIRQACRYLVDHAVTNDREALASTVETLLSKAGA